MKTTNNHTPTPLRRRRVVTDQRSAVNYDFSARAQLWRGMSPRQHDGWARLAPLLPNWEHGQNAPPLSGYLCFQQVGAARMAQNLPLLPDAPAFVTLPPTMGDVSGQAVETLNGVRLTLLSGNVDCAVQVWCCRPLLLSQQPSPQEKFALLATLPVLEAGTTDISALFNLRFKAGARDGQKLVLRFVPLSAEGFRGLMAEVQCEVTAQTP